MNAFFYGTRHSNLKYLRQGALIDNDRIWFVLHSQYKLPDVEECSTCLDGTVSFCHHEIVYSHNKVLSRFVPFRGGGLGKKVLASLRTEPLYEWSLAFREYVENRNWTHLDMKVEHILDFRDRNKILDIVPLKPDPSDTGLFSDFF